MYRIVCPLSLSNGIPPTSLCWYSSSGATNGIPLLQSTVASPGPLCLHRPHWDREFLLKLTTLLNGGDVNLRAVDNGYFPSFGLESQIGLPVARVRSKEIPRNESQVYKSRKGPWRELPQYSAEGVYRLHEQMATYIVLTTVFPGLAWHAFSHYFFQ